MNAKLSTPIALLIGRIIIVGSFYLFYVAQQFIWFDFWTGYATSKHVPLPQVAVIVGGLLLVVGGLSLITGIVPRIGVVAVVLSYRPWHSSCTTSGQSRVLSRRSNWRVSRRI